MQFCCGQHVSFRSPFCVPVSWLCFLLLHSTSLSSLSNREAPFCHQTIPKRTVLGWSIRVTFLPLKTSPVCRLMTVWGRKEGWDCVMLTGSLAIGLIEAVCVLSSWSVDLPVTYFLRVAFFHSKINCIKCLSELAHYINLL